METEQTLHDALLAVGLTHEPSEAPGVRLILRDGLPVFRGRCGEAWTWLREETSGPCSAWEVSLRTQIWLGDRPVISSRDVNDAAGPERAIVVVEGTASPKHIYAAPKPHRLSLRDCEGIAARLRRYPSGASRWCSVLGLAPERVELR